MSAFTDKWIDDHKEELVEDLRGALRFRTVEGAPEGDSPFGKTVHDYLRYTLVKAEDKGPGRLLRHNRRGCRQRQRAFRHPGAP